MFLTLRKVSRGEKKGDSTKYSAEGTARAKAKRGVSSNGRQSEKGKVYQVKRFKEFKLFRGWRGTVRRPDCLMEVPPVLGVRASGTGQLYERRLHLARY